MHIKGRARSGIPRNCFATLVLPLAIRHVSISWFFTPRHPYFLFFRRWISSGKDFVCSSFLTKRLRDGFQLSLFPNQLSLNYNSGSLRSCVHFSNLVPPPWGISTTCPRLALFNPPRRPKFHSFVSLEFVELKMSSKTEKPKCGSSDDGEQGEYDVGIHVLGLCEYPTS